MGKYIYTPEDPKHPREWITCRQCGKEALVKAHGKGFCSKSCAQSGANNSMVTRAPDDDYAVRHHDIARLRGKADSCVWECRSARYEWAHYLGDLGKPDEYVGMCKKCHQRFDFAIKIMDEDYQASNAKLTEEIVIKCRKMYYEDHVPQAALAERYGVHPVVMHHAITGKQWSWVPMPKRRRRIVGLPPK
jgi:hypothetical protein